MSDQNFHFTYQFHHEPSEIYTAINHVQAWWSNDFSGNSETNGGEFEVRFADVHYSKQRIIKLELNKKVVWQVTESHLSFLKNPNEWEGTEIVFEITSFGEKTELRFEHKGLVPEIECYGACTGGWNYYLLQSLVPFITTGIGKPNK